MSTVVCQGFLESNLLETTTTTTMRLKVVTPKFLESAKGQSCHKNDDLIGDWNSLQSSKRILESESLCIQPLDYKQSSSLRLSEKSLELCTESLGSETGSDTSESSILSFSLLDSSNYKSVPKEERTSSSVLPLEPRKSTRRSFPPPLTSLSGSNSLQVKPHREGGRLIIQAMEVPSTHTYFQTERREGRLRLSFWENDENKFESNMESHEECEKSHHEDEVVHVENDMIDDGRLEKELNECKKEATDCDEYSGDINGNINDDERELGIEIGLGMEMEIFQRATRRSRCKVDRNRDKGLVRNWEAFWVATT